MIDPDVAKQRMLAWLRDNPLTKKDLDDWAQAEEDARCCKCGRVIFCGDSDKMCRDPECGLKAERK